MNRKLFKPTLILLAITLLISTFVMPILAFATEQGKVEANVSFVNSTYNAASNTSTWTYRVIGGDQPSLSHWVLGICSALKIVGVSDNKISTSVSKDGSTGFTGLKFETSFSGSTARQFWIKVEGNWTSGMVAAVVKAGNGFKTVQVGGPTCSPIAVANLTASPTPVVTATPLPGVITPKPVVTASPTPTVKPSTICTPATRPMSTNVSDTTRAGKGTATFTIAPGSCEMELSFSSYTYPSGVIPDLNNGTPYAVQIFVDNKTAMYGPGTHTVEVDLPACGFHQLDLYSGPVIKTLSNIGHPTDKIIDWELGGSNNCVQTQQTNTQSSVQPTASPIALAAVKVNLDSLIVTSICSDMPEQTRKWNVRNTNNKAVTFVWKAIGSSQSHTVTVAANSETTFESTAKNGANKVRIFVDGKIHSMVTSTGLKCAVTVANPTPTAIPTASPITGTVSPTPSPMAGVTLPTPSPVAVVTLAPVIGTMQNLMLDSICVDTTAKTQHWLISNPNETAINVTYIIEGTQQAGILTLAGNSALELITTTEGTNKLSLFVNGAFQTTVMTDNTTCVESSSSSDNTNGSTGSVTTGTVTAGPVTTGTVITPQVIVVPAIQTPVAENTNTAPATILPTAVIVNTGVLPTETKVIVETPSLTVTQAPNGNLVVKATLPNDVKATGIWTFNLGGKVYTVNGNEKVTLPITNAPVGTYQIAAQFADVAGVSTTLEPVTMSVATVSGGQLPNTATPWFNFLLVGAAIMLIGILSLRRKTELFKKI